MKQRIVDWLIDHVLPFEPTYQATAGSWADNEYLRSWWVGRWFAVSLGRFVSGEGGAPGYWHDAVEFNVWLGIGRVEWQRTWMLRDVEEDY